MLRYFLAGLVLAVFCGMPVTAAAAGQVNAFIYHRFDESRYPSTNISAEVFKQQLDYLQEHDYQVLTLGEVVRRIKSAEPLPQRAAAISIDDAFTSFQEVAMPLLRQYDYPVSLFVNTDAVGSQGYLDWDQLRELHAAGVELGNHTASHDYLIETKAAEEMAAWRQRIVADISRAQQAFKDQLDIAPELFAYPYGEYSPELVDIVKSLGFKAAFAQQSGVIHAEHDLFTLPRFPMGGPFATLSGFVNKIKMQPLVVLNEQPYSPVVSSNPPELLVQVDPDEFDLRRANCFVQGDNSCRVEPVEGQAGWYRVSAEQPLSGRRNKYTLTVSGKRGGWHWYSHLWVNTESAAVAGSYED